MDTVIDDRKRKLSTNDDVPAANGSDNNEENLEEANTSNEENFGETDDHLRQFDVLDEVQGDESGSENGDNDGKGKRQTDFLIVACMFPKRLFSRTELKHRRIRFK